MKFSLQNKKIQGVISILIAVVILMSHSSNPPNGATGAPGETLCTECHGNGNPGGFDGDITVTGFPSSITPNTAYPLTVTVSNPNGLAGRAGFQFTVLNASNQKFGNLTMASANCVVTNAGGRQYVEHNPSQLFDINDEVIWSAVWTSPAAGTAQTIKLYAAANIANNDDDNSGDWIVTNQFTGIFTPLPEPLVVNVTGTNVACFGNSTGSATATVSGGTTPYSYAWSNGGSTAIINGLAPGTYTVTVTDNGAQTASDNYLVTQPASAVSVNINAGSTVLDCNNTSITLTGVGSGGTQPYTYAWSAGGNTPGIIVFSPGNYTVTVTDNNGCQATDVITITQIIPPVVTIASVPPQCEFDPVISLNGQPAGGFYSGPGVSGNLFTPSVAGPGNHTVSYSYTENGCTTTASTNILVTDVPTLNVNNPGTLCINGAPFILVANVGGGFYSGPGITGNQIFPSLAGLGVHSFTYTVNSNGCIAETTGTYTVVAAPDIQITPIADLCTSDAAVTLQAAPAGGSWSGTGVSGNTFNPGISGAGTFTLTYQASNINNCTSTSTTTVTVTACGCPNPAFANAGSDQSTCNFNPVQLAGGVNSTPLWTTSGDGTFVNPTNVNTQYVWGSNDSINLTFILTLTASDPDGNGPCSAFSDQMVVTNNSFELILQEVGIVCVDDSIITLEANPSGGTWSGTGVSGTSFDPALAGIGFHTLSYSVTNDFNCSDNGSIEVQVRDCDCTLEASTEGTNTGCSGDSLGTISAIIDIAGSAPYTYLWSTGDTGSSVDSLPPGIYFVTITDAGGCSAVAQGTLSESIVEFTITQLRANCVDVLCVDSLQGNPPFVVNWSNGETTQCITNLTEGSYSVTVTNSEGCTEVRTINFVPVPAITVEVDSITGNTELSDGIINISASGGIPPYTFEWELNGNFFSDEQDLDSLAAGSYTLIVTDDAGCSVEFGPYIINTSGIDPFDKDYNVRIYPSPAGQYFYIESAGVNLSMESLTAISMSGQQYELKSSVAGSYKVRVENETLSSGIYMIRIKYSDQIVYKKLVITR